MSVEAMKAIQLVYANTTKHDWPDDIWDAICQAIEAAVEEQHKPSQSDIKQEPVAWTNWCSATGKRSVSFECESELASQPLYTASQLQREWVGLTGAEKEAIFNYSPRDQWLLIKNTEAKLKEKNT